MKDFHPKLIIVSGPTASGKTRTSINIAQYLRNKFNKETVIVNFDSLLFYKELNIGTAKPTHQEMNGIDHYLINNQSLSEPLNASDYSKLADKILKKLRAENKVVLLVGGSGFYLRALIKGMYNSPAVPSEIKNKIQTEYKEKGIEFIREFLKENDKVSFDTLHVNDHYRNIRAYEHFVVNKSPISIEKEKSTESKPYDFTNSRYNDWDIIHFYLDVDKKTHQSIIEERANQMIRDGLIEEVKSILNMPGVTGNEKPLSSIGYKETIQYIGNEFSSIEEYIERICISTRQLAKSQRTFFNKVTPKIEINPLVDEDIIYKKLDLFI